KLLPLDPGIREPADFASGAAADSPARAHSADSCGVAAIGARTAFGSAAEVHGRPRGATTGAGSAAGVLAGARATGPGSVGFSGGVSRNFVAGPAAFIRPLPAYRCGFQGCRHGERGAARLRDFV